MVCPNNQFTQQPHRNQLNSQHGGGGGGFGFGPNNTPILFYSRRIGLDAGQIVPIVVGGRLLGRTGPYNIGALNMQTDDVPEIGKAGTNFSVFRMTRDILRRSRIGVIGTARSPSASSTDQSFSAGADAQFQLYENVNIQSYYARTSTPGREGDEESYRRRYDWNADRYGMQAEYLKVGEDFNPEVGFLRAVVRSSGRSRRPASARDQSSRRRSARCSTKAASTTSPARARN